MQPILNIAIKAARSASKIITRNATRIDGLAIHSKQRNDFVSDVDNLAEQEIIKVIRKSYPNHSILAEESGAQKGNEFEWIIDPLDGTTNFLHGFPHYAVSIALQHRKRLELGVVYDPVKEELFCAYRGEGAMLENRRIRVSEKLGLYGALLATGIPFREDQDLSTYMKTLEVLIQDTAGIRRAGSAALDLAYTAAGRFDGFWELGLKRWDMAAGIVLIQESGGLVSDLQGGENYMNSGEIVAGSPKVFKQMLQRLSKLI